MKKGKNITTCWCKIQNTMDQNGGHLRKMEIPLLKVLFGLVLAIKANLQRETRFGKTRTLHRET
jgi:hypothetical protein